MSDIGNGGEKKRTWIPRVIQGGGEPDPQSESDDTIEFKPNIQPEPTEKMEKKPEPAVLLAEGKFSELRGYLKQPGDPNEAWSAFAAIAQMHGEYQRTSNSDIYIPRMPT